MRPPGVSWWISKAPFPKGWILGPFLLGVLGAEGAALGAEAVFSRDEIRISVIDQTEEEDPVVSWNGRNFMAVWQSNRKDPQNYDLFAARISPSGRVLDPEGIELSKAPNNQLFPNLAWGGGRHFAVWQDLRSRQRWEIYGARFLPDGKLLDPEGIPLAVGRANARHPQVASDGSDFLAVWMEEGNQTGWDILGARIRADGKVMDRVPIVISRAAGDQAHPVLAWGEDRYLVVWMDAPLEGPSRITAAGVSADGKLMDAEPIILSLNPEGTPGFPAVAWGGGRFLAVWADSNDNGEKNVSGIRLDRKGAPVDRAPLVLDSGVGLLTFPAVQCAGGKCLVVWEADHSEGGEMKGIEDVVRDVRGAFLDLGAEPVRPVGAMIADRAIGNHFSKVATDGRDFLVVWKDYRTGTASSLARRITAPR